MLSPETQQEINKLASEMSNLFSPPELIPGCEVMDVADIDLYDINNGWIEAVCGKHNQQRCRWKGRGTAVGVGDYVDVLYFKSIRLFEVLGVGGTGAIPPAGGNVWPMAGECGISNVQYPTWGAMIAVLAANQQGLVGEGIFITDWTGGERLADGADLRGCGIDVSVLADDDQVILQALGDSIIQDISIINTSASGGTAFYATSGGNLTLINVKAQKTSDPGFGNYGFNFFASTTAILIDCLGYVSGGLTNRVIHAYESTISILGGYFTGDIYANRLTNPCTIYLYGPVVTGSITTNNGAIIKGWYYDADGNLKSAGGGLDHALIVKNTSGATRAPGDIGYINAAGEFKTTATAIDTVMVGNGCIVLVGGTNNTDIVVTQKGRIMINYVGAAPSAGDYLVSSATAGKAQRQTTIRPEIFAVCTANGAGGIVEALLLVNRVTKALTSDENMIFVSGASTSDFVSTIAVAGVVGDKVYYGVVTAGNVNTITPQATTELVKIILHNTTRGEEARIINTGADGGGNFIQVSAAGDIAGWVAGNGITARSQTNGSTFSAAEFFDLEITSAEIPALTTELISCAWDVRDTGGTTSTVLHPFEANSNSKRDIRLPQITNKSLITPACTIPVIQRRFQIAWIASGVGTFRFVIRVFGVNIASP